MALKGKRVSGRLYVLKRYSDGFCQGYRIAPFDIGLPLGHLAEGTTSPYFEFPSQLTALPFSFSFTELLCLCPSPYSSVLLALGKHSPCHPLIMMVRHDTSPESVQMHLCAHVHTLTCLLNTLTRIYVRIASVSL